MLAREILQRVREIQVRTGRQVADVLAGERLVADTEAGGDLQVATDRQNRLR